MKYRLLFFIFPKFLFKCFQSQNKVVFSKLNHKFWIEVTGIEFPRWPNSQWQRNCCIVFCVYYVWSPHMKTNSKFPSLTEFFILVKSSFLIALSYICTIYIFLPITLLYYQGLHHDFENGGVIKHWQRRWLPPTDKENFSNLLPPLERLKGTVLVSIAGNFKLIL